MSTYEFREYCGPRDSESYRDLLNHGFQVPFGQSFLDDFPIWSEAFSSSVKMKKFCIYLEDQIIASASIRSTRLFVNEPCLASSELPNLGREGIDLSTTGVQVALLGAVVCHERHRGQGLATRMVQEALNWARQQGVSLVFLWSNEYHFYRKLGFFPFGVQVRCSLRALLECREKSSFISQVTLQKGFNEGILTQIKQRKGGLVNDLNLDHYYRAHAHVQWYSLGSSGEGSAFAAVGRGIDLDRHVHEWGGNSEQLIYLLSLIQEEIPDAIFLSRVEDLDRLFPQWRSLHLSSNGVSLIHQPILEPLCLAHAIDGVFESQWGMKGVALDSDAQAVFEQTGSNRNPMTWDQSLFWFWGLDAS